jgi:hypothetical protein
MAWQQEARAHSANNWQQMSKSFRYTKKHGEKNYENHCFTVKGKHCPETEGCKQERHP